MAAGQGFGGFLSLAALAQQFADGPASLLERNGYSC